jgi:uncharacterized protein YifN (PemK superfamily)
MYTIDWESFFWHKRSRYQRERCTWIDAHLVQYLSRLRIHCLNNISFHRTIALLSSIFNQICHLSLKLAAATLISGSSIISCDIIQRLCIARLKSMTTYSLNLLLYVEHDLEEKFIFNSFFQVAFTQRQKPRVFIQVVASAGVGTVVRRPTIASCCSTIRTSIILNFYRNLCFYFT